MDTASFSSSSASGSGVDERTDATLTMSSPSGLSQLTVATSVMVALASGGIVPKLMIRLLSKPPQIPPPLASHETNVTSSGSASVTTAPAAASGPSLETVSVYVTFEPVTTTSAEASAVIEMSASLTTPSTGEPSPCANKMTAI